MFLAVIALAGASLGSAAIGANASQNAAQTQAGAAAGANANTMAMFQQEQANLQPWLTSGGNANAALQNWMGIGPGGTINQNAPGMQQFNPSMLPNDPSYQWQLQQGQNAILNNASAMGGVFSGNTASALQNYTQGLASTDYQNALNNFNNYQNSIYSRLGGISSTGANAAGGVAGLGATASGQISNNMIGAGNALAAGQVGSANAITGALGSGVNNYLAYNAMQSSSNPNTSYVPGLTGQSIGYGAPVNYGLGSPTLGGS